VLRFLFILPNLDTAFVVSLMRSIQQAGNAVSNATIINETLRLDVRTGGQLIDALDSLAPGAFDGIAMFAVDVHGVREAIDRAVERGLKVVTIVSDISRSKRHYFVGSDNRASGRIAAKLMGRFAGKRSGSVAVIVGSTHMQDQYARLEGFSEVVRSRFPSLRLLHVEQGHSIRALNANITDRLIKLHSDLVGIYSAGAGASGVIDALERNVASDSVIFIAHELSERMRQGLMSGYVDVCIAQSPSRIARSAVRVLHALCTGGLIILDQERIGVEIYFDENVPLDM
jgi:LacI family transcriptional regulator